MTDKNRPKREWAAFVREPAGKFMVGLLVLGVAAVILMFALFAKLGV